MSYYDKKVDIIDSADIVAQAVKNDMEKKNLLELKGKPSHKFFVSDFTASFEKSTKLFFKGSVHLQHFPLWENE